MDKVKVIEVRESVFANNDREADRVREKLKSKKTCLINWGNGGRHRFYCRCGGYR